MKKVVALLLIITMLMSLTGCAALREKAQQKLEEQQAALPRGKIEGLAYVCEDAGIRFVKSAGWEYLTEEELESLRGEAGADEPLIDMLAMDALTGSRVMLMYQPFNSGLNASLLENSYIRLIEKSFVQEADGTVEFGDPQKKELGDHEYTKIQGKIVQNGTENVVALYIRIEQKYVACIFIMASDETCLKMAERKFG